MKKREQLRYVVDLIKRTLRYRGLLALTIVTNIAGMALAFVLPWLVGTIIDDIIVPATTHGASHANDAGYRRLAFLSMIGAAAAVSAGVVIYVRGNCTAKLGTRIINDLRIDLFDHLQRLSLQFYSKERVGTLVSCLINDIGQASNLINSGMLMVVIDSVQALAAIGMLVAISWKLTLAAIGVLPLYLLVFSIFGKRVRVATHEVLQQIGKIGGDVQEQFSGIAVIKSNVGEDRERQRFEKATEQFFDSVVEQSHVTNSTIAISDVILQAGTVITLAYGGFLAISSHGQLTAGDLTKFLAYVAIMYGPLRRFAELNNVYQSSTAALARVFGMFYITPAIKERRRAVNRSPERGEVQFEGVRFRYDDNPSEMHDDLEGRKPVIETEGDLKPWVLDGLTFSVKPRDCVAFVGPSGSGKSTVVSLLPRLFDVTEGSVRIDGTDVRDFRLKPLRNSIAIVQQESFLFTGTIRDNLIYGRPTATDAEVVAAAKAANAHDFISALPDRYHSRVGERGVNLSGGQRQRLAIVRAILKNPRILILDEATSALDTESEAIIQDALDRLMKDRTTFIVAHRLSTIRNATRIMVLDQGRIVESGSHDELLASNGLYARLAQDHGKAAALTEAPSSSRRMAQGKHS